MKNPQSAKDELALDPDHQRALARQVRRDRRDDWDLLRWLERRADGRAWCWHLLLRACGATSTDRRAIRKVEPRKPAKLSLQEQMRLLAGQFSPLLKTSAERLVLLQRLVHEIKHVGTDDPRCPEPLGEWLADRRRGERETWGEKIARQYWPGRSRKRDLLRRAFGYAAAHLALVKELADYLVERDQPNHLPDRHRPRVLARALVNHLLGNTSGTKYFKEAPEAARKLVSELCADERPAEVIACLRHLVTSKAKAGERKDAPATRLKDALEAQFRLWKASRLPSDQRFAKDAVSLVPPWQMERMTAKRGDTKKLALRLSDLSARPGSKPDPERMKRYLRAFAFRSKSV